MIEFSLELEQEVHEEALAVAEILESLTTCVTAIEFIEVTESIGMSRSDVAEFEAFIKDTSFSDDFGITLVRELPCQQNFLLTYESFFGKVIAQTKFILAKVFDLIISALAWLGKALVYSWRVAGKGMTVVRAEDDIQAAANAIMSTINSEPLVGKFIKQYANTEVFKKTYTKLPPIENFFTVINDFVENIVLSLDSALEAAEVANSLVGNARTDQTYIDQKVAELKDKLLPAGVQVTAKTVASIERYMVQFGLKMFSAEMNRNNSNTNSIDYLAQSAAGISSASLASLAAGRNASEKMAEFDKIDEDDIEELAGQVRLITRYISVIKEAEEVAKLEAKVNEINDKIIDTTRELNRGKQIAAAIEGRIANLQPTKTSLFDEQRRVINSVVHHTNKVIRILLSMMEVLNGLARYYAPVIKGAVMLANSNEDVNALNRLIESANSKRFA